MIIVTNTSKITKGNGHKLIERFNKVGKVETMSGFLGLEVLLTQNTVDYDEVTISTRWNAKEDFQGWTKSQPLKMLTHIKAGCQTIFLIIKLLTMMLKLFVCQWPRHSNYFFFNSYIEYEECYHFSYFYTFFI